MSLKSDIEQHLSSYLQTLCPDFKGTVSLDTPPKGINAEWATPVALQLFKQHCQSLPSECTTPVLLAEYIAAHMPEHPSVLKLSSQAPGFLNISLSTSAFVQLFIEASHTQFKPVLPQELHKKYVVEFSSPNIAKPFTIGHLRSTIIGDCLAKILGSLGHTVFTDNHLGDWGTQFGKQIYALLHLGKGNKEANLAAIEMAERPVQELVALYVEFHQKAEEDPTIEAAGREWFKKLEDGDPLARELWQLCISWSLKEFQRIYQALNVSFTENNGLGYGEAFFEDKMKPVIAELQEKKLLTNDGGAQMVYFPNDELPPLMVIKQDGSTLYATRDLATDAFRLKTYGSDVTIVNEVGAEQSLYFQQLFRLEELAGWLKPEQRVHVKHGLYRFKDKKMSTRKGNVIWLESVLEEAYQRVRAVSTDLDEETVQKVAIGALKWNDLKRSSHLDIVFDWDEIVSLRGNSGPYVQYTVVRALSILTKAKRDVNSDIDALINSSNQSSLFTSAIEKSILIHIEQFSDIVQKAAREFAPHFLCVYTYELAQKFNSLYAELPIDSEQDAAVRESRLILTTAVAQVLSHALSLLGIEVVEKM